MMRVSLDFVRARQVDGVFNDGTIMAPVGSLEEAEAAAEVLQRFATDIEIASPPPNDERWPNLYVIFFKWIPLSERLCDHCGETPNMHHGIQMNCWERTTQYERDPYLK